MAFYTTRPSARVLQRRGDRGDRCYTLASEIPAKEGRPMPGETVEKVIAKIRANRERFETFCRSLTDEELSRPVPGGTWTVKDFIIHLDTLDPELVRWFEAAAAGTPDVRVQNPDGWRFDLDDWNERVVSERRDWPLDRILAE